MPKDSTETRTPGSLHPAGYAAVGTLREYEVSKPTDSEIDPAAHSFWEWADVFNRNEPLKDLEYRKWFIFGFTAARRIESCKPHSQYGFRWERKRGLLSGMSVGCEP